MKIAQREKAGARGGAPWGGPVRLTLEESLETVTSHERGSAAEEQGKGLSRPVFIVLSNDS